MIIEKANLDPNLVESISNEIANKNTEDVLTDMTQRTDEVLRDE